MKNLLLIVATSVGLIFPCILYAQNTSDDVDDLFDDDGYSSAQNVIKFGGTSLVQGDYPVLFERALSSNFSVEAGVGIILPYYYPGLIDVLAERDLEVANRRNTSNQEIGRSLYLQFKYYTDDQAPEGRYSGVGVRHRLYDYETSQVAYTDITMNYGWQRSLKDRLMIDLIAGFGGRLAQVRTKDAQGNKTDSDEGENKLIFVANARIGYLF